MKRRGIGEKSTNYELRITKLLEGYRTSYFVTRPSPTSLLAVPQGQHHMERASGELLFIVPFAFDP